MDNREAIEWFKKRKNYAAMVMMGAGEMFDLAITALEKQNRVITVTDIDGAMLASISNNDIVWTDRVRVIVSEEQDG